MDRDDVRVIEGCDGERLARESLAASGIGGGERGQHLQRDIAAEARVVRPIDLAHPAGTQRAHNFVRADTCTCGEHAHVNSTV